MKQLEESLSVSCCLPWTNEQHQQRERTYSEWIGNFNLQFFFFLSEWGVLRTAFFRVFLSASRYSPLVRCCRFLSSLNFALKCRVSCEGRSKKSQTERFSRNCDFEQSKEELAILCSIPDDVLLFNSVKLYSVEWIVDCKIVADESVYQVKSTAISCRWSSEFSAVVSRLLLMFEKKFTRVNKKVCAW